MLVGIFAWDRGRRLHFHVPAIHLFGEIVRDQELQNELQGMPLRNIDIGSHYRDRAHC
jgi:hypothetical protein